MRAGTGAWWIGLATLLVGVSVSARSEARTVQRMQVGELVHIYDYFYTGQTYTIETNSGWKSSFDPVLRLLDANGVEVARSDDNGGTYCDYDWLGSWHCEDDGGSELTFTAPSTGSYSILIHNGDTSPPGGFGGALVDMSINGTQIISQWAFDGQLSDFFSVDDWYEIRATAQDRKWGCHDPMLLVVDEATGGVVQWDDDSGPSLNPAVRESAPSLRQAIVGLYPGGTCGNMFGRAPVLLTADNNLYSYYCSQQEPPLHGICATMPSTYRDHDGDGLTSGLEVLLGTNPDSGDTDDDRIPDTLEVHGNDGFFYATGAFDNTGRLSPATTRHLYIEVDYMVGSMNDYTPYAILEQDVADRFFQDSDDGIEVEIFVDSQLPFTFLISKVEDDPACTSPNCIQFTSVKSNYFAPNDVMKRQYFRYAVYRHQMIGATTSSGYAEIGGDDYIVAKGAWAMSIADERGTFIHELGHNLVLTHHGSGYNPPMGGGAAPNSVIYQSVMNYRYQFAGVPGTGNHTYSWGTQACAPCSTSPKQSCVNARNAGTCAVNANCDCDKDDWAAVDLNVFGDIDYDDGADGPGDRALLQAEWATAQVAARRELREVREHVERARATVPKSAQSNPVAQGVFTHRTRAEQQARAALIEARLQRQGAVRGIDYHVSRDGTALYAE